MPSVRSGLLLAILEKHLRAYHGEPQFSCPLCPRIFRHKASLEQHSFSKHYPGFQKLMCDLCGKTYLTKWGLTRHARIHSDPNNNSKSVLCKTFGIHIPGMISYRHTNGLTYQKQNAMRVAKKYFISSPEPKAHKVSL